MKVVKPFNELTLEELCVHMAECQQTIERSTKRNDRELILFCNRCDSPYSINTKYHNIPICDDCYPFSKVIVKEVALPIALDRHLVLLCKLLVRAAGQLDEDKAYEYRNKIYDYIYGKDVWHDDMRLFVDNAINGYPYDFVNEYELYISRREINISARKPDKDEMLEMLYDQVDGLIRIRDKMIRKVDYSDIREYHKNGMEIPRHIEWQINK